MALDVINLNANLLLKEVPEKGVIPEIDPGFLVSIIIISLRSRQRARQPDLKVWRLLIQNIGSIGRMNKRENTGLDTKVSTMQLRLQVHTNAAALTYRELNIGVRIFLDVFLAFLQYFL